MSNDVTQANNQGQADGSAQNNSSSSFADFLGGLISFGSAGSSSTYNPPSDPDLKEAYDQGFNNAKK